MSKHFNIGQDGRFTNTEFTSVLLAAEVSISMDGKGDRRDNVFVEQVWRSLKYEDVYLKAYDNVSDARKSISDYIGFYNSGHPHSRLDRPTPTSPTSVSDRRPRPPDLRAPQSTPRRWIHSISAGRCPIKRRHL